MLFTAKKILSDIRLLNANHKSLKKFAKEKYVDENGFACIHVYSGSDSIYNPLTSPNDPEISGDVIALIDEESYYIPVEYPIKVIIHSKDDLDEAQIEKKLKEHYWKKLADKDNDIKNNRIISFVLFIIGLLLLSAYFVLENLPETKDLFNEVFSIAASFAIWESVDYALLSRNALKIDYLNDAQLALLRVSVSDNEKAEVKK